MRQLYCSPDCSDAAHALVRKMAKRAGVFKPPGVGFSRADLGDRDRWHCGICGGRVSKILRHPDPLSASVDHIIPLARGGTNDPENLQLAHLRCNLSKRDSEQLAAVT
jgi:5-methylcytosine-specific restriction endonuclease McrA